MNMGPPEAAGRGDPPKTKSAVPAYVKKATHPTQIVASGGGVGGFKENFVLVRVPHRYLADAKSDLWVPAPRKELYQLEVTTRLLDPEMLDLLKEIAETELKAMFSNPNVVQGNQRIPRVGRNALTLAALAQSGLDGLEGFTIEKDPVVIGSIMKESLRNVITRKVNDTDTSTIASERSEVTEKGSVGIPAANGPGDPPSVPGPEDSFLDALQFGPSARVGNIVPRPFIRPETHPPVPGRSLTCLPEDRVVAPSPEGGIEKPSVENPLEAFDE